MNAGSAHPQKHRKHTIPLESNPQDFTELIHKLGVSVTRKFEDVLSLDDPELLAFLPRGANALILVISTTLVYEDRLYSKTAE
jgi:ubiquitin carboxyl-terminal hydrolase L3